MSIKRARSYNNGIEFYVTEKDIIIKSVRDENGNIKVTREKESKIEEKEKSFDFFSFLITAIFSVVIIMLLYLIIKYFNTGTILLSFLFLHWCITISYFIIASRNKKNASLFRYHAIEHKIIGYLEKYNTPPINWDDVMKMNSISKTCGSNLIALRLIFETLFILGICFIPGTILKIIWCIISILIILYLMKSGKCCFLQKMVIKEPTYSEIEVAICGIKEYAKLMDEEKNIF